MSLIDDINERMEEMRAKHGEPYAEAVARVAYVMQFGAEIRVAIEASLPQTAQKLELIDRLLQILAMHARAECEVAKSDPEGVVADAQDLALMVDSQTFTGNGIVH